MRQSVEHIIAPKKETIFTPLPSLGAYSAPAYFPSDFK